MSAVTAIRRPEAAAVAEVPQDLLDDLTCRFAATAAAFDRDGVFPRANFDALAQAGLIGLTVAADLGGRGASLGETLRVLGAVAKGEPSTALILFMTYGNHLSQARTWPRAIYERLAHEAVAGRGLVGVLRVEPELGTPVRGGLPATVARQTSDGWTLSGAKIYSTGSTGLDWFIVWAKTDEATPRVGLFLVDPAADGITINHAWDHLGMRATVSHEVVFDDTPVTALLDLRAPADWAPVPGDSAQALWNALAISTIYDGVAQAARDWLAGYLNDRVPSNLGASLATLPRVQEKFGEIEALLYANRVLIEGAAARVDAGDPPTATEANHVKYLTTSNSIRAVAIGLELTGNPGLSRNNPLERHYRDVLCSRIHSPQDDTILVGAGKAGLAR